MIKLIVNLIEIFFYNGRNAALLCGGISLAALIGALTSQYGFGLQPCVLCLYQRWPHLIVVILSLAALLLSKSHPRTASGFVFLMGITFFVGAFIASFHIGVEQHWWLGLEGCSMTVDYTTGIEEIQKQLAQVPAARCDEIPWSLFGISMAGYNALLSLGLGLFAVISAILTVRRLNGY